MAPLYKAIHIYAKASAENFPGRGQRKKRSKNSKKIRKIALLSLLGGRGATAKKTEK